MELTEHELRGVLAEYLTLLQRHPSAEEVMQAILTEDFETGFEEGFTWKGVDGLRDFLSQRDGFFDEKHVVKDVLEMLEPADGEVEAHTRLEFFLRRWEAPSPTSEGLLSPLAPPPRSRPLAGGRTDGRALRRPERELEAAFATPDEGLNR